MRYLHPVGMAKGKAKRSVRRSLRSPNPPGERPGLSDWFWTMLFFGIIAGLISDSLITPTIIVVSALFLLAFLASFLPDSKPAEPEPDMAVLEPPPSWTPPTPRSMETLRRSDRASDENREQVVTRLHTAAREGRIDSTELEDRVGKTYRSRTIGELDDLLHDLP